MPNVAFDIGQPTFSLQRCDIAANNTLGSFGAASTVPSAKVLALDFKTVSDQSQGDSAITATAAQAIGMDGTLDVAAITFQNLAVITGNTISSTGAGSTLQRQMSFGNLRFQYFGLLAQAWGAENAGDTLIWIPKCKVMSGWTFRLEFGKIVTPQFKFTAIQDDFYGYIWKPNERATIGVLAIPPAWA